MTVTSNWSVGPMAWNSWAMAFRTEATRVWPHMRLRGVFAQTAACAEGLGEINGTALKRLSTVSSVAGLVKGKNADEWTAELAVEICQAIGALLQLAVIEGVDLDKGMPEALEALRQMERP